MPAVIAAVQGDITRQCLDAIVNAAPRFVCFSAGDLAVYERLLAAAS